jgi:Fe-S oxidoreductase/nitrate reductase gamma subunit
LGIAVEPTREIYWNIANYGYLYVLLLITVAIFSRGVYRRYRAWMIGQEEKRFDQILQRLIITLKHVFVHIRIIRYPYSGAFHFLMFGGMVLLFFGTVVVFLKADFGLDIMHGGFYLYFQSLALDLAGVSALLGIIMAGAQRYVRKPGRYRTEIPDAVILMGLFVLVSTGFLIEGARLSVIQDSWARWSPVGHFISGFFNSTNADVTAGIHRLLWWFHLTLALALFAYVPYSKLFHFLLGPLNIFLQSMEPKGITVKRLDIETAEKFGAQILPDFSWKQLFDLDACTECGRCQDNCPVTMAGKSFSPREVILGMREQLRGSGRREKENDESQPMGPLIGNTLPEDWLWLCRTCRACMEECPVFIEVIPKFVELRRFQVMEEADYPKTLQAPIESLESRGHPYRGTTTSRTDWLRNGDGDTDIDVFMLNDSTAVDVLYWVGCTTALNEENMGIARNICALLKTAGVSFGILGDDEFCCGEPARRIGNEYLFETMVRQNMETFSNCKFKTLLTNCPHCFNMFKHEYSQFGVELQVVHHSEFLLKLINEKTLNINDKKTEMMTYHDPCYLGRYNDIYAAPRDVIDIASAGNRIEMDRSGDRSFCCGGGGGGAWLSEEGEPVPERVNVARAEQALATGASTMVTACPFCMMMMRDGINTIDDAGTLEVVDLAQLIGESI